LYLCRDARVDVLTIHCLYCSLAMYRGPLIYWNNLQQFLVTLNTPIVSCESLQFPKVVFLYYIFISLFYCIVLDL